MKAHILESFIQRVWNEGDAESASDLLRRLTRFIMTRATPGRV